ncbi:MAG: YnfA family protein [Sphaerobacteraceae bacterium]|nr:MAG: YnfA family protein [Sphaerobacteraceae bacterium]
MHWLRSRSSVCRPHSPDWRIHRGGTLFWEVSRTLLLFAAAGLAEIGGGWLIWQWLRVDRPWPFGLLGAGVLIGYGIIHTFQEDTSFGRIYAAYGAMFLIMAFAWGMAFDRWKPDRWDFIGAGLCLIGVCIMLFAPRSE